MVKRILNLILVIVLVINLYSCSTEKVNFWTVVSEMLATDGSIVTTTLRSDKAYSSELLDNFNISAEGYLSSGKLDLDTLIGTSKFSTKGNVIFDDEFMYIDKDEFKTIAENMDFLKEYSHETQGEECVKISKDDINLPDVNKIVEVSNKLFQGYSSTLLTKVSNEYVFTLSEERLDAEYNALARAIKRNPEKMIPLIEDVVNVFVEEFSISDSYKYYLFIDKLKESKLLSASDFKNLFEGIYVLASISFHDDTYSMSYEIIIYPKEGSNEISEKVIKGIFTAKH